MNAHPLLWLTPAPLWGRFADTGGGAASVTLPDQQRPALLRFAGDDFMDQLLGALARDPRAIGGMLARPETWRTPAANPADHAERLPLPRPALSLLRRRAARQPRTTLAKVDAQELQQIQAQPLAVPLKLYQPAHQRYYLVAASLVCRLAGFPEHAPVPADEQLHFVLRRLLPDVGASGDSPPLREYAYVKDAQGAAWRRAGDATFVTGEELLPLFPLRFNDDAQRRRTLWGGLVPVGRREELLGASVDRSAAPAPDFAAAAAPAAAPAPANSITARKEQFKREVGEPWKNVVRSVYAANQSITAPVASSSAYNGSEDAGAKSGRAGTRNLQWQMQSWLVLLDFADYLKAYLPALWSAIESGQAYAGPSARCKNLYDWLAGTTMPAGVGSAAIAATGKSKAADLREALQRVVQYRAGLEGAEKMFDANTRTAANWPAFTFLLAGLDTAGNAGVAFAAINTVAATDVDADDPAQAPAPPGQDQAAQIDRLVALVTLALEPGPETDAPPVPFAVTLAKSLKDNPVDAGWFVIRYLHLRRDCGPLHPPTLSAPTQRFQLASFFDADAPARPIRISLPTDTTPAGLRKHAKNTAFALSDVLCGQVQRAKGMGLVDLVRSVLPWPLHKDLDAGDSGPCNSGGVDIGMICSLSIPIITICAFILLMIMITLFDLIFCWLPFFAICLPVPKFKAKS